MKLNVIALAMLCGTLFATENAKFTTKPDQKTLAQKEITSISILPEGLKKDKFYRLTMQVKLKKSDKFVATLFRGSEKTWDRTGVKPEGWSQYTQYFAPGEAWNMSLGCRSKGNTMQVKDIKLAELDEKDFTTNLLPPLKDAGWHSAWVPDKEPKLDFVKSEDSPFGAEVFSTEISKGTGYPALLPIPAIPGRTLTVVVWSKGEPADVWWVTATDVGMQTLAIKKEWNKQVLKFNVKIKKPMVSRILFWKPKNYKPLKCTFGKVEAYYEK